MSFSQTWLPCITQLFWLFCPPHSSEKQKRKPKLNPTPASKKQHLPNPYLARSWTREEPTEKERTEDQAPSVDQSPRRGIHHNYASSTEGWNFESRGWQKIKLNWMGIDEARVELCSYCYLVNQWCLPVSSAQTNERFESWTQSLSSSTCQNAL